jgi:hypothetical protein
MLCGAPGEASRLHQGTLIYTPEAYMADVKDSDKEEQKKKDAPKPLDSKDLDKVSGGSHVDFVKNVTKPNP